MKEAGAGRLGLWERHWVGVLSVWPHTQHGVEWRGYKAALGHALQAPSPGAGLNPHSHPS